jgi:UDP-N-acetylmuramoylalanine--D-glutamate ligase
MDLTNKRVTIIGLSDSGFSAAKLLKRLGAKVRISELRGEADVKAKLRILGEVEFETGAHTRGFVAKSDLIVVSPGVSPEAEPLRWAGIYNIPVISELELGYMFCPAPIVAVTGTNGKSTTVHLLHEMFRANGISSYLLGNIGRPICEDIMDVSADSVIALEVSSFQLERIKNFKPKIAVLLNLTQDHLDRYRNMDGYKRAKLRIFENQESCDYAILNYDDPEIRRIGGLIKSKAFYFSSNQRVKGSYLEGDGLFVDLGDGPTEICKRQDVSLSGTHNIENVLAAALALKLIVKKADILPAAGYFIGLRHRFELVAEIAGIKFIDDSKSTTVDSTLKALESFPGDEVILIAGGRDKGSDYSPIINQAKKLKYAVLIGEARKKIKDSLKGSNIPVAEAATMQEAVSFARGLAGEGDTVLLSPMCSSFDMFKDYKERGEVFRQAVFDSLITSGV